MATSSSPPPPAPPHQFLQGQTEYQQQQQQQYTSQYSPQYSPQYQPVAVAQPQKPSPTTRKSRSFSFRSDKSHGSHNNNKIDLTETSAEKEAKRLHSKADPRLAMEEAEPSEVAATVKSSLAPLRGIALKDAYGNPISDPDLSNPTRSRWERPLDTIRSFEAAIDGGYDKRRSILRSDSESVAWGNNRRSSYYGGNGGNARFSHDSYYNTRPQSTMYGKNMEGSQQDLRQGGMGQRDAYQEQQSGQNNAYGSGPPISGRRTYPRMASEPQFASSHRLQQVPADYPLPINHRSYETVASASGSGSSAEPLGYQTDPTSSDNSSLDRMQAVPKRLPEPVNDYGIGFGSNMPYQPPTFTVGVQDANANGGEYNGYSNGTQDYGVPPPQLPPKDRGVILRKAMTSDYSQQRPTQPEKRKSWFTRRFSKQA